MRKIRRSEGNRLILALVALFLIMAGIAAAFQTPIRISVPKRLSVPLKPAEDLQLERDWGPLAPVVKAFSDLGGMLSGGTESVGLEAELGYTSTTGESVVFKQKFSGVGFVGMSGIYVKPSLGDYKALKLYDQSKNLEGQVWVKPAVRVKAYQGIPENYAFNVKLKISVDGEVVHAVNMSRTGKGAPPSKINFDKVAVPGKVFHLLLIGEKQLAKKILRGESPPFGEYLVPNKTPGPGEKQICFYADYQGMMKFEGDEEPIVKELKNIKLGCFSFEFKETGDFEMIVERNVTVAALAEVMATSGMEGMTPVVETTTITVTMPYTSYVTTYLTTGAGGQVSTITQTITQYQTRTLTKTRTKWKTTTVTKIQTIPKPYPVTVTTTKTQKVPEPYAVTVTKTITKYVEGGGGFGSVLGNVTVITPEGGKLIKDVRPGDLVLTERGFREVKEVKAIQVSNLYRIELENGRLLIADDAQPVVTSEDIKRVGELRVGDELVTLNGTSRIIGIKRHELKAYVYDLIFDKPLNYYANGVLVNDAVKYSGVILLAWPYSEFIFIRGW